MALESIPPSSSELIRKLNEEFPLRDDTLADAAAPPSSYWFRKGVRWLVGHLTDLEAEAFDDEED